jgi:hypothetical protein
VFVSCCRLDPEGLAFFAGFAAGDSSFMIRENNAGTSWCCGFIVKLRADDTPLLAAFRDWSGVGELYPSPARGGSHPQTSWTVARRRDCLKIADILSEFPPLGKAGRQFEVWRRAVHLWAEEGQHARELDALAAELRGLHRSAEPVPCRVDITPEELGRFFAGFASAEAHFGASSRGSPRFAINLRADDGPLLALFHDAFGLGYLRDIPARGASRAALGWRIGRLRELQRLVALLEACPPRGRAGYVYRAWRELVRVPLRTPAIRRAFAVEIRRRRRYVAEAAGIERVALIDRRRERCAQALREWALSSDYPGGSPAYERWRRRSARSAPTRNTIVAAYGSWLDALETLGLDTSAAHDVERVQTIRAGVNTANERRRATSRKAIVEAVRLCIAELGHEPGASEFLRWRAKRAPESPSQMTIYRRFPGGFEAVLEAARRDELAAD